LIVTSRQAVGERGFPRAALMVIVMEAMYLIHAHALAGSPHRTGTGWPLPPLPAGSAAFLAADTLAALMALWFRSWKRPPLDPAVLYGSAALFGATLLLAPALGSPSLADDMGHGRVLAHYGANPYLTPASTFPPDPILGAMGRSGATPLAGPAWISLASLLALAGMGNAAATALAFKALLLAAHLINGALVASLAARWRERPQALAPAAAAAFYLWNPVVITQALGEGRHHVVALTFLLLAFRLAQRGDESLGWGCAAMACLVDYMMLPVAGFFVVQRCRRAGRAAALAGGGLALLVCAAAYAPYLKGFDPSQILPPWWLPDEPAGPRAAYEWLMMRLVPGAWLPTAANVLWGALALALLAWWLRTAFRLETLAGASAGGGAFVLAALLSGAAAFETGAIGWTLALAAAGGGATLRGAAALLSAGAIAVQAQGLYRVLAGAPPRAFFGALLVASLAAVIPVVVFLWMSRRPRRPATPAVSATPV
jgi:hypothetical protein